MIHTLQPDAVVLNNHHMAPIPGEDIQGFEQDLPGMNTAGFNPSEIQDLPLEVCMTINDHWGFHATDNNQKSTRNLIHKLVRSASVGANYLLNVGPTAEGEILPIHALRLRQMGSWLKLHGESVYATRAGSIATPEAVVTTQRGDTHYLHVLDDVSDGVYIKKVPEKITSATLLRDNSPLTFEPYEQGYFIDLPRWLRDPYDTVIALK